MANSIVREPETAAAKNKRKMQGGARGMVVGEIMADIQQWRKYRDSDFEAKWDEFYFKWRGFWRPEDKTHRRERSKLVAPLTQMAVDLTSAEIIEAILGREYFVDLPDDVDDQQRDDMHIVRMRLIEDLRNAGFMDELGNIVLNGSLYGTGIAKVQVLTKIDKRPFRDDEGKLQVSQKEIVDIKPIAIDPGQFVADPGASLIEDMKGCAHEFLLPLHKVRQRQAQGIYDSDFPVGPYNMARIKPNRGDTESGNRKDKGEVAFITEYYGLVPTRQFLMAVAEANKTAVSRTLLESIDPFDMTEVIATIANETHLLRVILNPEPTGRRLMVGYPHERVPGSFWGRGVCEKALSVQRAMDSEMRARIDALAWSNHPMFAGDLNRLPPDTNLSAWPGKFWGTRGNPDDILKEMRVNGPDPKSFSHMQDLERMGQQATGALDSIASLRAGIRDETATGSALAASGFIKRSKRTMYNVETFMTDLVSRVVRLKMKYDPERYPADYNFQVRGTVGIMAREIEQQYMTNLLNTIGPESPAAMPIIMAIFEHSGSPVKNDVLKALKAIQEREPTPQEKAAKNAALMKPILENKELQGKILKLFAEGALKDAQEEEIRAKIDDMSRTTAIDAISVFNDLQETENQVRQLDIQEEGLQIEREKIKASNKD